MRFFACTLQYCVLVLCFIGLFFVLPWFIYALLSGLAYLFFAVYVSSWIVELAGDYFFQARVIPRNKAVLITGCDSGFGHEFARVLDKRGYHVFACCLDSLGDGAVDLKDVCTNRLKIVQMDVTKDESVQDALKTVEESLGNAELWAIVNNAGIVKGFQTELSSMQDYEDCLQVNTLGMIRVTRAFLPLLRKAKGRVLNVCSKSGRFRVQYLGPYTVSKTAAVAFTDLLRQELREFGMRVISIEPEFFKTPMCSETNIQNVLKPLDHLEEDIKKPYGSKYLEQAKKFFLFIFAHSSPDIERVCDAVESAVSLHNPADVYKPVRSTLFSFLFFAADRVPLVCIDTFLMFLYFCGGVPAPSTGVNVFSRIFKM